MSSQRTTDTSSQRTAYLWTADQNRHRDWIENCFPVRKNFSESPHLFQQYPCSVSVVELSFSFSPG